MSKKDEPVEGKSIPATPPTLSDLRDHGGVEVPEVEILTSEELIDKEITICAYAEKKSEFSSGSYYEVEIVVDGEVMVMATGARMIMKKIEALQNHLPFRTTIVKKGRRLDLE